MDKIMKFTKCGIALLLCVFLLLPVGRAEAGDESNENAVTLLLEEGSDTKEVAESFIQSELVEDVIIIEEIGLVHVIFDRALDYEEFLEENISMSDINSYGKMAVVEQEAVILSDIYSKEMDVKLDLPKARSITEDLFLFEYMAWHAEEVTNDWKSMEITTGNGVEVALIDSGVDTNHPVLAGKLNLDDAVSYVTGDSDVSDTNSHGTATAGIIMQIVPDAVITPYKVLGDSSGDSLWTIQAIIQAANDGKDIISMSLGTYKTDSDEDEVLTIEAFERAVDYARNQEVILVASAGNAALDLDAHYEANQIRHLPGSVNGVLATSAAAYDRTFASYSNWGSNVQFSAPGGDLVYVDGYIDLSEWIYIAYPTDMDNGLESLGIPQGYSFSYGTSLAAPCTTASIAGIIAYYTEQYGEAPSEEIVKEYLVNGAYDLGEPGYDRYYGNGLVNLYNSVFK